MTDADRVLAFRLARSGLDRRRAESLAEAAACPASDFARDAALLALAARREGVSRAAYEDAVDRGDLVLAHAPRGAIHALAPADLALFGPALIATGDDELGPQLGQQVQRLAAEHGLAPTAALAEVAEATRDALRRGRALGKDELHAELRERVRSDLMPWCRGCRSHHVAPMLWRYATVAAGARLDSRRRYRLGPDGAAPEPREAARRFLRAYGPATAGDLAAWAGLSRSHAARLWAEVDEELQPVTVGRRRAWMLGEDAPALADPPPAEGLRLLPPGDPYLQGPNRPLLAPDDGLRRRLFRPVASPGAVLVDGRLAGLWRARARRGALEVTVEPLGAIPRKELDEEAARLAALRGADGAEIVVT